MGGGGGGGNGVNDSGIFSPSNENTEEKDCEAYQWTTKWIKEQTKPSSGKGTEIRSSHSDPYTAYFIDCSCKIECSPVVGRHFVAGKNITEGQVLFEEYPYLYRPHAQIHAGAMLTLATCASLANTDFHGLECGLKAAFSIQTAHVFRMIAKTGGPLAMIQSAEQFADYSVEDYLANCALQITRPVEKTADERMATYAMSSSLISHNEVHSVAENACHSVRALEVVALYELISRVELSPDRRTTRASESNVAHVQCLVASLVNYSCDCNSTWKFTAAGMITFFANRDIKSGEQITISYGTCPAMPYHQRQKRLNDYYFACAVCSACFAEVSKYAVLRCGACPTGAVPIQTVINQVPVL
ncbi:hypothetical protein TYRP_015921 [Tyrophagus putrescentiae]|nr:hypothetical protein TYRP_015921 [Tyrophagus putrescentiae]